MELNCLGIVRSPSLRFYKRSWGHFSEVGVFELVLCLQSLLLGLTLLPLILCVSSLPVFSSFRLLVETRSLQLWDRGPVSSQELSAKGCFQLQADTHIPSLMALFLYLQCQQMWSGPLHLHVFPLSSFTSSFSSIQERSFTMMTWAHLVNPAYLLNSGSAGEQTQFY